MTERLKRINELAHKQKEVGLTEEEKAEQKVLRDEYIKAFRANMRGILDHTSIKREDGTKTTLEPNKK